MFPLFQYLSAAPSAPNPTGAVSNAVSAMGHLGSLHRQDTAEKNQMDRFGQTMGLQNRQEDRYQADQDFTQKKDAVSLLKQYNDLIRQGDYAGAAGLAPSMKGLGMDLTLVPPDHPDAASAQSPDDFHAAQPAEEAPPAAEPPPAKTSGVPPLLSKFMASGAPQAGAVKAKPVPPLLSKFMASPPPSAEEPAAEASPEAAKARVAEIGGNPADVKAAPEMRLRGEGEPAVSREAESPGGSPQLPIYRVSYKGENWGVIDPNKSKAQNKEAAQRLGSGFVEGLPENVQGLAEGATGPAETPSEQKFAIDNEKDIILQGMRSTRKGGGAGVAPGAFPIGKEAHALQTEIRTTMQAAATDQKVADSNKTLNNISQGLAGLQEGGTVGERQSVAQLVKAAFPGAISDQERTYITEANGIQGKIENALGYWVKEGHMDPALVAQVKRLQQISEAITKERLDNAATEVAENWGRIHPELPDAAKEAYIQEGISLHSPEAAKKRRDRLTQKVPKRPEFLK